MLMRLTPVQQAVIRTASAQSFGGNAGVWLFGSRVDDSKKGGDIDLYIEPEIQEADELVAAKLQFLIELHKQLGEQKIDVIIRRAHSDELPIYRVAKETGVRLL
ncbi:MAG TPA: nucleotidyltransferase domain-containing protein [Burkholderiales bacterium]|nr:nucleotidyltransferase domain-containing protein [Burkholderiales bacterium]